MVFHSSGLDLGSVETGTIYVRATVMKGHKWVDVDTLTDNRAIKRGGMSVDDYLGKVLSEPGMERRISSFRRRAGASAINSGQSSLAAIRLSAGLTQQQLADRMGMQQPNIARMERNPSAIQFETMAKLATALTVPLQSVVDAIAQFISSRDAKIAIPPPDVDELNHVH